MSETFFGLHIHQFTLGGQALALLLAVLLGGLIGLDRELRGQPAGLRTHILVCVGSALITITSAEIGMGMTGPGRGDPARIAAQIVTGIGFLGAGAILREGMSIRGLTTAASIWTTAGIGIAIGASPRLGQLAVVATMIVLVVLVLLNRLEEVFKIKKRIYSLEIEVCEADHGPARVLSLLENSRIQVLGMQFEEGKPGRGVGNSLQAPTRQMRLRVRLPGDFDQDRFNVQLAEEPGIVAFELE